MSTTTDHTPNQSSHGPATDDGAITQLEGFTPNRSPHSLKHRISRVVWGIVQSTLFAWSPKPCFRWRVMLLRLFGAQMHPKARPYPKAKIWYPKNLIMHKHATLADGVDCYCVAPITIGEDATVSQYSYLCAATHDFDDPGFPLVPLPITIGTRAWVAADAFVGPGVNIGDGCVIGARASVFKHTEPWMVYAGSPAKALRKRGFGPSADDAPEDNQT